MHGIRNTITDPAVGPQTHSGTKSKGANKWANGGGVASERLTALVEEVAADEHAFDVYVDGKLFLQTDYVRDIGDAVRYGQEHNLDVQWAYVGPQRREGERRSREAYGTDGGPTFRTNEDRRGSLDVGR